MDGVVRNLSNDDSVTDSQMLTAISRWAGGPCLPITHALMLPRNYVRPLQKAYHSYLLASLEHPNL